MPQTITHWRVICKFQKIKNKEKILKEARGEKHLQRNKDRTAQTSPKSRKSKESGIKYLRC